MDGGMKTNPMQWRNLIARGQVGIVNQRCAKQVHSKTKNCRHQIAQKAKIQVQLTKGRMVEGQSKGH